MYNIIFGDKRSISRSQVHHNSIQLTYAQETQSKMKLSKEEKQTANHNMRNSRRQTSIIYTSLLFQRQVGVLYFTD
jgi:hypothetical protein